MSELKNKLGLDSGEHNSNFNGGKEILLVGRAYSHRIPLVRLKCLSEKRCKELDLYLGYAARRRGEEPGRAPRVKSGRHDRPLSLFRFGA